MTGAPLVEIRNLSRVYRTADGAKAIEILIPALNMSPGDRLALVAPSGAGKTTLLNLLLLAIQPSAADAFILRTSEKVLDVTALWSAGDDAPLSAARANMMSFVLQSGGLLPFLTARENILLPAQFAGADIVAETFDETVSSLGIVEVLDKLPAKLSGGERQRVAMARALVGRPPILIADEPTASLDQKNAEALMDLIMDLCHSYNTCLILASHDVALIERYGLERLAHSSGQHPDGHVVSAFWREGLVEEAA